MQAVTANDDDEEYLLRSAALRNATGILLARQRAEEEGRRAKEALERKEAELARTVAMQRATLEATTDAILVTDDKGVLTDFNQNFISMWGLQPDAMSTDQHARPFEAMSRNFADPQGFIARVEQILGSSESDEFDLLDTVDGKAIERYSRIQSVDGLNVGRVWSFRDITERRREADEREQLVEAERAARAELERAGRMKDEFLATLSHELRTPLTAILGWANVLQRKRHDAAMMTQGIDTIMRNARAQGQIIEDLLDISRIVFGKVRLDRRPTDLTTVIDAAVETVRPAIQAKQIQLRQVLDPAAGLAYGDPHRLQQVVWNLLSNAVKFTPNGGSIDVLLEGFGTQLQIVIKDSGTGIDPEVLPYVFERFRQADSSTTRRHGGLGLGLSIVKRLVDLHAGDVRVESAGAGRGTSFIVTLPKAPAMVGGERGALAIASAKLLAGDEIDLTGVKVLVIDDERDARELVGQVLAEAHAEVMMAASAVEARQLLETHRPDVIVSDIGMPGEDGYQFICALRKLPHAQGGMIPAIALTAYARSEDRVRAMRSGFQVHVSKPVEPPELAAAVAGLAGRTATAPK